MGCVGSLSGDSTRRRDVSKRQISSTRRNNPPRQVKSTALEFQDLSAGLKPIIAPTTMMPVVCFTKDTFPLITSFLNLEDSTLTEIRLPIVAASIRQGCRIVCFSQVQFLTKCFPNSSNNYAKLVMNTIHWLTGDNSGINPVLLMGFSKNNLAAIGRAFQEMGIFFESCSFRASISNYKAVFIPSNFDISETAKNFCILDYIKNTEGGLGVFYVQPEDEDYEITINSLLIKYGLSYTYCILNENNELLDAIQVQSKYSDVKGFNFVTLVGKFKEMLQGIVHTSEIDDLVTSLRHYIMVCDQTFSAELISLFEDSWDFLRRNDYHSSNGICPKIIHGIVVVLLIDLYSKLPPSHIHPIPESSIVPGNTGSVELGSFEIELTVNGDSWTSTGLWLPAGVIGTVTSTDLTPGLLQIQIGSHREALLTKPSPWKRWPVIVTLTDLSSPTTSIVSPFGGIVYIIMNGNETRTVKLNFSNFCIHPKMKFDDPKIWHETCNYDVPWGEIDAGNVIITVQTDMMKKIRHHRTVMKTLSQIAHEVSSFMSCRALRPYRIVFDIELIEDSPYGSYPLVFPYEYEEPLLNGLNQPSTQLFTLINIMALVSLRENCFDSVTETAISYLCATVVFNKLFEKFDPFQFNIPIPILFTQLWEIHNNCDSSLISRTLSVFQDESFQLLDVPDDIWVLFVRQMCSLGQQDFTKVLEQSRPIPLSISLTLAHFPEYKPTSVSKQETEDNKC